MTSMEEINLWLKDDQFFIGCFAKENLPSLPSSFPKSMIVKCDNHFIAIVMTKHQCLYFDSYGEKIIDNELINFLSPLFDKVIYSSNIIQHEKSRNCGKFCVLFVKNVFNKKRYIQFIKLFNIHYKSLNDIILLYLFEINL